MTQNKLDIILTHIRVWHDKLRNDGGIRDRPLLIGFSGCQGCGKTTVTKSLVSQLESRGLRAVAISQDDFYLPHSAQRELALSEPGNRLLEHRGNAGTHDLKLCRETLESLLRLPSSTAARLGTLDPTKMTTRVPRYDKGLHGGRGDRLPVEEWLTVQGPLDVILFEGWNLGFRPLSPAELKARYEHAVDLPKTDGSKDSVLARHRLEHLLLVNERLNVEATLYDLFDVFVHIRPLDIGYVHQWRWEQEQSMRSSSADPTSQIGLSKDQVADFVDRFLPAYVLYLPRLNEESIFTERMEPGDGRLQGDKVTYQGRHLQVVVNENREVVQHRLM